MSRRRTIRFKVGFSVRFLSVGGSELFSNVKTNTRDTIEVIEQLRHGIGRNNAFCDYYDYLVAVSRAEKNRFLAVERVIVDDRIEPAILGSSVKGVIRHAIDKLFLEQVVLDRVKNLGLREDVLKEVMRLLRSPMNRKAYVEAKKTVERALNARRMGQDIIDRVLSMYILYMSPYSCLSPSIDVFSCSLPLPVEKLALFKKLNKLLISQDSVSGCVDVDGELHCLPLDKLCVTCSLFGCNGLSSPIRFSTFRIAPDCQRGLVTFYRVFADDKFVSSFTIEVLNYDDPIRVEGAVSVDASPDKMHQLLSLSYALYADHSISIGSISLNVAEHAEKLLSCGSQDNCFIEAVESLYKDILKAGFETLKQGIIGLGHRTRLGFGRITDYTINIEWE